MKKLEFISKWLEANPEKMPYDESTNIICTAMDTNAIDIGPGTRNLIIIMEEFAELIQAIEQTRLGIGDRINLIEELADNTISLDYIRLIFNIKSEDFEDIGRPSAEALDPIIAFTDMQIMLSKLLRERTTLLNCKSTFLQQYANVASALKNTQTLYNISDDELNRAVNVKLERLKAANGIYQ